MSSTPYAAPLRIEHRPSHTYARLQTVIHLCAGIAVFLTPLEPLLGAGLGVAVLSSWVSMRRSPSMSRGVLTWDAEGQWHWDRAGAQSPLRLQDGSYVSPAMTVLNFLDARGRRRGLVLFPDSADAEALRRLRVRLRLEIPGGEGERGR